MGSDSVFSLHKRQKQQQPRGQGADHHAVEASPPEGMIPDVGLLLSMSSVDQLLPPLECNSIVIDDFNHHSNRVRKRSISSLDSDDSETREQEIFYSEDASVWQRIRDWGPSLPSMEDRVVNLNILNPYYDSSSSRHPNARGITILKEGDINGYVKFRLNKQNGWPASAPYQRAFRLHNSRSNQGHQIPGPERIPMLPAGFGSNMELDLLDCLLWKFYHTAFCAGRTLLSQTNLFLVDFARMADSNLCVRHSVLALAATYVLDYSQEPVWRIRANYHYRRATELLNEELGKEETHRVGKEDAVVSSLIILTCEDIITWEMRRNKSQRWLEGVRSAIEILDQSNPGYQFNNPVNVQNNSTRTANANLIASFDIVARPVMPLDPKRTSSKFTWLLYGTRMEKRRIHGGTGVCPKLLHMFSQITSLATQITELPDCPILPRVAAHMEKRLVGFRQWSELSIGYGSEQELLAACVLDESGQVNTAAEVTDLTGQSWVSAAQIYLQCRFYRRPRSHHLVKAPLNTLLRCIERMPCKGSLFTSQSPFFPIFIMGAVSVTEEERKVARVWFETVVDGLGCRSSVPPVWTALQDLWVWMDQELDEDRADFDGPIADRKAWWEQMVGRLMTTCGPLSLC